MKLWFADEIEKVVDLALFYSLFEYMLRPTPHAVLVLLLLTMIVKSCCDWLQLKSSSGEAQQNADIAC